MPLESKRIAKILLETPSEAAWKKAIEVDNVLQKNSVDNYFPTVVLGAQQRDIFFVQHFVGQLQNAKGFAND